jgi:hypothetical protein
MTFNKTILKTLFNFDFQIIFGGNLDLGLLLACVWVKGLLHMHRETLKSG